MMTVSFDTLIPKPFIRSVAIGVAALALAVTPATAGSLEKSQLASLTTEAGSDVGDVAKARGNVGAIYSGALRQLSLGSDVLFHDRILTGDNSRAEITFKDETQLFLGDNSELIIDEMVFEPGVESSATMTLAAGVFRMISGKVNKVDGGSLTLHTPVATIGIRGTDFWGLQEEDKLTMVLIDNGKLYISSDNETVTLDTPLTGVVIERGVAGIQTITITPEQLAEAAKTITW
ncbi:MAG: FecR family protein [Alphaproteobacteria bacterium]